MCPLLLRIYFNQGRKWGKEVPVWHLVPFHPLPLSFLPISSIFFFVFLHCARGFPPQIQLGSLKERCGIRSHTVPLPALTGTLRADGKWPSLSSVAVCISGMYSLAKSAQISIRLQRSFAQCGTVCCWDCSALRQDSLSLKMSGRRLTMMNTTEPFRRFYHSCTVYTCHYLLCKTVTWNRYLTKCSTIFNWLRPKNSTRINYVAQK